MRKSNKKLNFLRSLLVYLSLTFFILGLGVKPVHAQVTACDASGASIWCFLSHLNDALDAFCNPDKVKYENIAVNYPEQGVQRTVQTINMADTDTPFFFISGLSFANTLRCIPTVAGINLGDITCTILNGAPPSQQACVSLSQGLSAGSLEDMRAFSKTPVAGSLLGLYYNLDYRARYSDAPASLAYYFNKEVANVPVLGTALAQDVNLGDSVFQRHIIVTYTAWKFMRNIALSLLAGIMLIIGVMMINRTRINSQTVVNIQYALPKVVLAVVLIAFSYPIVATMANFFYNVGMRSGYTFRATVRLNNQVDPVIDNFWGDNGALKFGYILVYVLSSALVFVIPGVGWAFLIIWVLCMVIILGQAILVLIKWFILYAKLLIEIILSPVELALAAIPGGEDRSGESKFVKWFKKIIAYGLSMLALNFLVHILWYVGLLFLVGSITTPAADPFQTNNRTGFSTIIPSFFGFTLDSIMFFMIMIVGYSMILKVPGQLQYALMGEAQKSRDK